MNVPSAPRIDLAQVGAMARALLRRDGNYRRTALTIALMMALVNLPVMMLDYLPTLLSGAQGLTEQAQSAANTRAMVFSLMMQVLVSPALTLGMAGYMLKMYHGQPVSPMDLFDGLAHGRYLVSVRAALWRMLSMFAWVMIPVSILSNGLVMLMYGQQSLMFWLGLALLFAIMINRGLAYGLQYYYLAREPRTGAIMSLKLSTLATRGRLREIARLYLRHFHCIILAVLPNVAIQLMAGSAHLGLKLSAYEQALLGVGGTLATILTSSLFMPALESALVVYFIELSSMLARRAKGFGRTGAPGEGTQDEYAPGDAGDAPPGGADADEHEGPGGGHSQ